MEVLDFISIGEVMIQLNSITPGPLRYARYFEVHVAGSEANVMIGLAKLGFKTGLITRLGRDEFGEMIIRVLRGEGVDTSHVKFVEDKPTGIYFIQRHYPIPGKSTVFYYRHGSAASYMDESDVDVEYVSRARAVFLTGITPALSDSCLKAVSKIRDLALNLKKDLIFDTNIRLKLWRSSEKARSILLPLMEGSKIIFTNKEDLNILYPERGINEAASLLLDLNTQYVVVKMGEEGAVLCSKDGKMLFAKPPSPPHVEDVIGAGDAFDAAFIAGVYSGLDLEEVLKIANLAGFLVVTVRGDIEAQPDWKVLEVLKEYYVKKIETLR
jgi:sugar/nucleoside kinase (ribokinase family)